MTDPEHYEYVTHIVAGKKMDLYEFLHRSLHLTTVTATISLYKLMKMKICYISRMCLSIVLSIMRLLNLQTAKYDDSLLAHHKTKKKQKTKKLNNVIY